MTFLRNRLGRRIVLIMILGTAVISTLAAAAQLYIVYLRDLSEVYEEFEIIETSFQEGLENALWRFDFNQIDVLLDGIHAQKNTEFLQLEATTGQVWTRGQTSQDLFGARSLAYRCRSAQRRAVL